MRRLVYVVCIARGVHAVFASRMPAVTKPDAMSCTTRLPCHAAAAQRHQLELPTAALHCRQTDLHACLARVPGHGS